MDESDRPSHDNPVGNFLKNTTSIKKSKNDDDLIDVHVGNPLKRITKLLEDIKQQKAFSFTLKGSLGIMGVALVIGAFGIFGGTRAFCDKGIQTKMGTLKTLTHQDRQQDTWIDFVPIVNFLFKKGMVNRTILITPDNQIYRVFPRGNVKVPDSYLQSPISYITGSLDSCSNTISVENQNGIQSQ